VLRRYLARSITMLDLLTGKGDVDDNIRMLRSMGLKFAGRTIYCWGGERRLPGRRTTGREIARRIHRLCPEMILQAAIFEIVTRDVNGLLVPHGFGQEDTIKAIWREDAASEERKGQR
jgi:hypothetical protein